MLKKLLATLLCMQLLLTGCSPRTGEKTLEEEVPEASIAEETPVEQEPETTVEEMPTEEEKPAETPPAQQEAATPQPAPPPAQEPVTPSPTPEPPAQTANVFDVSLLDAFKSYESLRIGGFDRDVFYENGTSFDPFIDDLKTILKDQQVITLTAEQQGQYQKKNTQEHHAAVHLQIIGEWFNPELFVFGDFAEFVYNKESTFISIDDDVLDLLKALVERTPGDRDPDLNKNLDPKKPDPAMG